MENKERTDSVSPAFQGVSRCVIMTGGVKENGRKAR